MSDNDDDEWFTICDEKNIVLKKNDTNMYKITFNISMKNKEDTVLNILKNGQLFELLSALNPDVIETVDVNEHGDIHDVFMSFKNNKKNDDGEDNDNDHADKIVHVFFSIKYSFGENKCVVKSKRNSDDNDNQVSKIKNGKEFIPVSKIKLIAVEKNNKTSMCLTFKIDKKVSNIVNMYVGLYFKKIFYRFKQYFE